MAKPGPRTHRVMSLGKRRFLYCHDCNAVHHVTPFDSAPVFEFDGMEIRELPQDDRRNFMDRHSGHRIGELISVGEKTGEAGALVDPMRINYIEATDGQEAFVLRSVRKQIVDSLAYEVLPRQRTFMDVVKTLNLIFPAACCGRKIVGVSKGGLNIPFGRERGPYPDREMPG